MEASVSSSPVISSTIRQSFSGITVVGHSKPFANCICKSRSDLLSGKAALKWRIAAVDGVSAAADPVQAEVAWQTAVGAIAGVTPFVVAGIEFSKRIIAQRKCKVCGGTGLVLRDKWISPMAVMEKILLWLDSICRFTGTSMVV